MNADQISMDASNRINRMEAIIERAMARNGLMTTRLIHDPSERVYVTREQAERLMDEGLIYGYGETR